MSNQVNQPLIAIELNEVNVRFVERYVENGLLHQFRKLLCEHGYSETTSETTHEHIEPWIQWVSAHTGLTLAEHGVFRLGDIVYHDIPQIWEQLEKKGLRVGAISPMNAKCCLNSPAFFVPDPWTKTNIVAPSVLTRMYYAIAVAVNQNAEGRMGAKTAIHLIAGALRVAAPRNYLAYMSYAARALREPWYRAIFLDRLMADLFVYCVCETKPHFASLFLNAAAHIQHHYMFSSAAYDGPSRNPAWYIKRGKDPLLDVYRAYDGILQQIQARFPGARLMIATGLHQDPHSSVIYYWRLRNHAQFLRKIGVPFVRVEPRMSRDFLIVCDGPDQARAAEAVLNSAHGPEGMPLFEVDNRGDDLFAMLIYPHDVDKEFSYNVGNQAFQGLREDIAFVALKNGQHNGIGYFLDTGAPAAAQCDAFPLTEIPQRITNALFESG